MKKIFAVRNGKVVDVTNESTEVKKVPFHIGGKSSFKWNTFSQNKTWIQDGNVVREKQGKRLSD
tara:strand:+ start:1011 stop:1202 length:192 start_codon:yes stop_codon:yes gene_type:complete